MPRAGWRRTEQLVARGGRDRLIGRDDTERRVVSQRRREVFRNRDARRHLFEFHRREAAPQRFVCFGVQRGDRLPKRRIGRHSKQRIEESRRGMFDLQQTGRFVEGNSVRQLARVERFLRETADRQRDRLHKRLGGRLRHGGVNLLVLVVQRGRIEWVVIAVNQFVETQVLECRTVLGRVLADHDRRVIALVVVRADTIIAQLEQQPEFMQLQPDRATERRPTIAGRRGF